MRGLHKAMQAIDRGNYHCELEAVLLGMTHGGEGSLGMDRQEDAEEVQKKGKRTA